MNKLLLAEVAMCEYTNQVPTTSLEVLSVVKMVILSYLNKVATPEHCSARLLQLVGNTKPFERVYRIVKLSESANPLPNISSSGAIAAKTGSGRRQSSLWTVQEDDRLLAGIYKYGTGDWGSISKFFGPGRTRAQCSQRWLRGLNPLISKEKWSKEQDTFLLMLVSVYGKKNWTLVSQHMTNRCDVQCRYRYQLLEKMPDFEELMQEASKKAKDYSNELRRRDEARRSEQMLVRLQEQANTVGMYQQFAVPVIQMPVYPVMLAYPVTPPAVQKVRRKTRSEKKKRIEKEQIVENEAESDNLIEFDESIMGISSGMSEWVCL